MFNLHMKKKIFLLRFIIIVGLIGTVSVAQAADPLIGNTCKNASMDSVTGIITWASCLLMKAIVPFLFMLATAGFIYGLIKFFLNPDSKDKKEEGKKFILWGLIALFVMTAMWGIVGVFTKTFEVKNEMPQLPTIVE
jgi:membrane protease YdiL (CAAX protease family)